MKHWLVATYKTNESKRLESNLSNQKLKYVQTLALREYFIKKYKNTINSNNTYKNYFSEAKMKEKELLLKISQKQL